MSFGKKHVVLLQGRHTDLATTRRPQRKQRGSVSEFGGDENKPTNKRGNGMAFIIWNYLAFIWEYLVTDYWMWLLKKPEILNICVVFFPSTYFLVSYVACVLNGKKS